MSFRYIKRGLRLTGGVVGLVPRLLEVSVLALCLQLVILAMPLLTQWIIDSVVPAGDKDLLKIIIIVFVFVLIFRVIFEVLSSWMSVSIDAQFGVQWSAKIMWHLLRLPLPWFDKYQVGDVVSRYQSMRIIQSSITARFSDLFIDFLFLLLSLIVMIAYSVRLALIAFVVVAVYLTVRYLSFKKIRELSRLQLDHDAELQSLLIENLQCVDTIKISGLERRRAKKWMGGLLASTKNSVALRRFGIFFSALFSSIQGAETILIIGVGANLVIDNDLTLGMLMAFVSYKTEFTLRAQRIVDNVVDLSMLKLHVDRLSAILLAPAEELGDYSLKYNLPSKGGVFEKIEFIDVDYRYDENSPWVLKGVTLTVNSGERLVITGPTGCGKSTLIKIALGLIRPTNGQVKINGRTLDDIGLVEWREYFAAVLQSDQLFNASIAENIALSSEIDWERMKRCAAAAHVDKEIDLMPDRYATIICSMGGSLSGGQRQRILIARAIYKKSPIIIFDEATSHLDGRTEKCVNASLNLLPLTMISIAHRQETIKAAMREYRFHQTNVE